MNESLLIAIARFPDRSHAIEDLARVEEFRSHCADLAEAEAAMVRWGRSFLPVKDARCAENRDPANDLAVELKRLLIATWRQP